MIGCGSSAIPAVRGTPTTVMPQPLLASESNWSWPIYARRGSAQTGHDEMLGKPLSSSSNRDARSGLTSFSG
jgi:hypothetical protein